MFPKKKKIKLILTKILFTRKNYSFIDLNIFRDYLIAQLNSDTMYLVNIKIIIYKFKDDLIINRNFKFQNNDIEIFLILNNYNL